MTNFGKCDTCRRRKVKCDEQRPTCGACRKKGRTCYYSNVRTSIFVYEQGELVHQVGLEDDISGGPSRLSKPSITIKESQQTASHACTLMSLPAKQGHKAGNGSGRFLTLRPKKTMKSHTSEIHDRASANCCSSCSPKPPLLCPQARVSTIWGSIFGFEALELNPLGGWIKTAWLRAGEDTNLDLALDYGLKSMQAFQRRDPESVALAYAIGEKALLSVQAALASQRDHAKIENLIIAVMLHCAAEQFIDLGSAYYIPHVLGISELLRSCLQHGLCSDVIRNVMSLICLDEVNVSIFWGRSSSLENIYSPHMPLDGPCELDVALFAVDYLLVKLPRLVCSVRSAAESWGNIQEKSEAVRVINALYDSDADVYCRKALAMHSTTVPCLGETAKSPTGSMLEFDDLRAFVLATRYHLFRTLICGLIQTLSHLDPGSVYCDIKIIEQEDIRAATSLAMCLDYALTSATYMPLTALGMLIPLQLGFGAWHRLQMRQPSPKTLEHQQAGRMKEWSLENIHYLEAMWSASHSLLSKQERLEQITDLFAGGALLDDAYNYRRFESLQSDESTEMNNPQPSSLYWLPPGPNSSV